MKNKLFILPLFILSVIFLSACTPSNQTTQNSTVTPTINQESGNDTEEELLNQLNNDKDSSFDSDLNSIQTELGK